MEKFRKIVAIEDVLINEEAVKELHTLADEVEMHYDAPADDAEIIRRIGTADAVLVSFRTRISRNVIESCPGIRYIGAARQHGITVLGVKDYGDEGVVEYAVSELVRFLHGFGDRQWKPERRELTRQKVGIIGLGKTGGMLADAFRFFGAEVCYFSRTRKQAAEQSGIKYLPLHELLGHCDIIITCLPRNTCLLGKEEFDIMGDGKILMNTSIGPTFDVAALKEWLGANSGSWYFCDGTGMGTIEDELSTVRNVAYTPVVAGKSIQSTGRLSRKALDNIRTFLGGK